MKIVKISKKDSRNVLIEFDNDERLILNYEVFLRNGLRKGFGISEDRFSFLIDENRKYYIKSAAIKLFSKRLHSEKEIRTKLLRKAGYDNRLIDSAVEELKEKNLIDDYKFAAVFSEEMIRTKLWGLKKIKAGLIKKGVSPEIIGKVLKEKLPEGNLLDDACTLAAKKIKSLSGRQMDKKKLAVKIYSFLSSRGYDYETSRQAVEKVFNETFNE
jgi:regulatory protein